MNYIFLLGYALIAFSSSAHAALSPEFCAALDALASNFSKSNKRMIVTSLKSLFSDRNDAVYTRRVEAFIRALSDRPHVLHTIYNLYEHQHYLRTGRASLDKQEWNNRVRSALKQSIADPRASLHHWFKCESQNGLRSDFLQGGGMCQGLSTLKILLYGKIQESIDYTQYRETKEIIPFSELLGVVPSLSDLWFQQTYQSLLSGRRPSSAKERIDHIIFRSLVKFLQKDITEFLELPKLIECTASHLRSTGTAQHTFNMNARQEALEFFKCVLPQHERLLLSFTISSKEKGHAVTVIQDKGSFCLWDSNGYSFQSPDVSKFTENFFRLVQRTYPEKEDTSDHVSALKLSIHGVNTIGSALDVPIQLDARYQRPAQLPYEVGFFSTVHRNTVTGAIKIKTDFQPFRSILLLFPPRYSRAALTPFLINTFFWALLGNSEHTGPECASKKVFLATTHSKAWEAFGEAFLKDFALARAFKAVGNFCRKSLELPLPRRGREAHKLCFERIESFYQDVARTQLNDLGDLSHIGEAFNLPEAKAIAEQFTRASFQRKAQLLEDYSVARTEQIRKAQEEALQQEHLRAQELRIEALQEEIRALRAQRLASMESLGT